MTDSAPAVRRYPRTKGPLLALLFVLALVAVVAFWLVQRKSVVATALFHVDTVTPSILGNQPAQSGRGDDFEIFKKTQIALLKSKFVLTSALINPAVAALPVFAGRSDPVDWLQEHLEVGFPGNSEILEIKLRGTKSQAQDLVQIVDAVAAAYKKEVLGNDKSRHLAERDMLERSLQNLNAEIKRKYEDYLDIAKSMGRPDGDSGGIQQQLNLKRLDRIDDELTQLERDQLKIETGGEAKDSKFIKQRIEQLHKRQAELEKTIAVRSEKSVELITRKSELDQLQTIANDMSMKLEQMDIDNEAPLEFGRSSRPHLIGGKLQPTISGRVHCSKIASTSVLLLLASAGFAILRGLTASRRAAGSLLLNVCGCNYRNQRFLEKPLCRARKFPLKLSD